MNNTYAVYPPANPIDIDSMSFYEYIRTKCEGPNSMPLHRVCTLMRKMKARWLVEEDLAENRELRTEFEAIGRRCDGITSCEAKRLTFFADVREGNWRTKQADEAILGYVVLVTISFPRRRSPVITPMTYIYEAVLTYPGQHIRKDDDSLFAQKVMNYYYHCWNDFTTSIGTQDDHKELRIEGCYFAQQNSLTSVCAHAAAQMAVNNLPRGKAGPRRKKLTSERINEILGIDHRTQTTRLGHFKLDPSDQRARGLTVQQIVRVAKKLKLSVLQEDFVKQPDVDAAASIYPYVESCCPTILGIQRPQLGDLEQLLHVVTVLGHTRNTDRWGPEAGISYKELTSKEYIPTSAWVCHFLINDDNFGMYRTLNTDDLHHVILPAVNANLHPSMAITFVPKGVKARGMDAEHISFAVVKGMLDQIRKFVPSLAQHKWIRALIEGRTRIACRTFLIHANDFVDHLASSRDRDGHPVDEQTRQRIRRSLPNLVWDTEISLPDLVCGNMAKLGDVISSVDHNYEGSPKDAKAVLFVWLPKVAIWGKHQVPHPWPLTSYIPVQRVRYAKSFGPEW